MEWQDISTAPKDGTLVLLAQIEIIEIGKWVAEETGHYETVSEKNGKRVQEWVSSSSGYWDVNTIYDPTHWMPLP
ncbi:MAG: hypothetical protein BVN33_14850, partial [Proteobacteria bacterium ST_bin13]